jgi:hypothetical protein
MKILEKMRGKRNSKNRRRNTEHVFVSRQRTVVYLRKLTKLTPWPQSASELYRPSNRRLLAKLLLTSADRGCHVVSVTDPYGRILGFLEWSRYFSVE